MIPHDDVLEVALGSVCAIANLEANDEISAEDYDDEPDWILKFYSRPVAWQESSSPSNLVSLQIKWAELQQVGDGTEQFARYAAVNTNELEGVFQLKGDSSKKLARCGLAMNSIEGISRTSRHKMPDKILSIIKNTQECYEVMTDLTSGEVPFDETCLLRLHRKLLDRDNTENFFDRESQCTRFVVKPMGRYREVPCFADHPEHKRTTVFCPPTQLEEEMAFFWGQASSILSSDDIDPFRACATLQYIFLRIHPFADGNGRIGRIISSIPLLKAELPPVIVSVERKGQYFQTLETADDTGDIDDLARFLQNESFRAIQDLLGYVPKRSPPRIRRKKSPLQKMREAKQQEDQKNTPPRPS